MTAAPARSLVHRLALATACVALLPIVMGALVTTMQWGMAFLDWPSSDGHNMLAYPWLNDLAAGRPDKFVEHGHRLAGMVIGLFSIALVAAAFRRPEPRVVRVLCLVVLASVILQGLLGGARVLQNRQALAMAHGSLAAVVFSLMGALVLVTGRSWRSPSAPMQAGRSVDRLKPLAVATPVVIAVQYVLGGMLRHLGTALHEHLGMAVLVVGFVTATLIAAHRSRSVWLRRSARWLFALVLVQAGLGAGAWVTRFGFATFGYVAVQHAPLQVVLRTSHTVVGMLVLMTAVLHAVRVFRLSVLEQGSLQGTDEAVALGALSVEGGTR